MSREIMTRCMNIAAGLFVVWAAWLPAAQAQPTAVSTAALEAEVEKARQVCADHRIFSAHQNCECIGEKFREARLKAGPQQSLNNIINSIGTLCPDKASITAYRYKLCLKNAAFSYRDFPRERHETFCTCVSQDYAKRYMAAPINSIRSQTSMNVQAQVACGSGQFLRERGEMRKKRLEEQKSRL
ncbi:MAG TPA: hypothetical protein VNQ99_05005 [Xanthobacteraceae bacterium]|nr:hypothetical protein [Xanthobacteraceae bacterium]